MFGSYHNEGSNPVSAIGNKVSGWFSDRADRADEYNQKVNLMGYDHQLQLERMGVEQKNFLERMNQGAKVDVSTERSKSGIRTKEHEARLGASADFVERMGSVPGIVQVGAHSDGSVSAGFSPRKENGNSPSDNGNRPGANRPLRRVPLRRPK